MRTRALAIALALLALGLAATAPAAATEVSSPPVWVSEAQGQSVRCMVVNLGRKPIEVDIGTQEGATPVVPGVGTAIQPGASFSYGTTANGTVRCVVTGKFSKRKIAITVCARDVFGVSETCASGP